MSTLMKKEALESPQLIVKQLKSNQKVTAEIGELYRKLNPYSFLSVGRGSSHHACLFFNYLLTMKTGKMAAPLSLSLLSFQHTQIFSQQSFVLGISQSGMSPDIVRPFHHFQKNALATIALVNNLKSDLATSAQHVIPLGAEVEQAVAATKSFILSATASVSLVASFTQDKLIQLSLDQLPNIMLPSAPTAWNSSLEKLSNISQCLVISRGIGFPFAYEMALKLKETCQIQAEAISSAEVKHGPWALIKENFPVILLVIGDTHLSDTLKMYHELIALKASPILIAPQGVPEATLSYPRSADPYLNGIIAIQYFYCFVSDIAKARGLDPDHPRHLQKVTKTN